MNKQSDIAKNEIEIDVPSGPSSTPQERCPRCQGLLVQTFFQVDLLDNSGPHLTPAWRCINCGVLLDLQVLKNRALDPGESPSSSPSSSALKNRSSRGRPRLHGHIGLMGRR